MTVQPMPGDVVLISRKLSVWTWLRSPVSSLISWRIRDTTGSRWNHVAGYVGDGEVVEAEWDRGVRRSNLADEYPADKFDIAVATAPRSVDRRAAVSFWNLQAHAPTASYDWRSIVLMRLAVVMDGPDGIRRRIRNSDNDDAWICSELCAAGWQAGGFARATREFLVPGDFEAFIGKRRGAGVVRL